MSLDKEYSDIRIAFINKTGMAKMKQATQLTRAIEEMTGHRIGARSTMSLLEDDSLDGCVDFKTGGSMRYDQFAAHVQKVFSGQCIVTTNERVVPLDSSDIAYMIYIDENAPA